MFFVDMRVRKADTLGKCLANNGVQTAAVRPLILPSRKLVIGGASDREPER